MKGNLGRKDTSGAQHQFHEGKQQFHSIVIIRNWQAKKDIAAMLET